MSPAPTGPGEVSAALDAASRDGGAVLATLVRRCHGDLELAQDALQDAYESAIVAWRRDGVPDAPAAWLRTTAWRKVIDRARRDATSGRTRERLASMESLEPPEPESPSVIRDDQLKLIFCCCHPALAPDAQVALTLRAVGGLSTAEIARIFLVAETTMARRITRAKRKVTMAGIPFGLPRDDELADRLEAVLGVVYVVFTAGHHGAASADGRDPCLEAIRLGDVLAELMPDEPEVAGLRAMMLLHHARLAARFDEAGRLVPLDQQDRVRWDRDEILRGTRLVSAALRTGRPGSYQLQAAIAALHCTAPTADDTDWPRIVILYDQLAARADSPVVELNRAVAVTMAAGPRAGLSALDALIASHPELDDFHRYHAARAEVLRRAAREVDARQSYRRARELATNPVERAFLDAQLDDDVS